MCDTLLRLAERGFYRPLWSKRILDETAAAIGRIHPDIDPARIQHRIAAMNGAFEDAQVDNWEPICAGLDLPDPDDRHVLAAAIAGGAQAIVTFNLKDFPEARLAPSGIEATHPDVKMPVGQGDTPVLTSERTIMALISSITLEAADPTAAESFYAQAFGLSSQLHMAPKEAGSSGFRAFTRSLVVSQPATVDVLVRSALEARDGAPRISPARRPYPRSVDESPVETPRLFADDGALPAHRPTTLSGGLRLAILTV